MKIPFIKLFPLSILTCVCVNIHAQTPTAGKNAVTEQIPRNAMTTISGDHTVVQTSISYSDGFSRSTQVIQYKGVPDASKDLMVSSSEFDILGRPFKVILPTPATGATGGFFTTPQANAVTFYGDDAPFSNVDTYEASPLNRALKSYGAGKAWRDNSKYTEMQYEKVGTEIELFTLDGITITKSNFPANSLYKEIGISERGKRSITYKDKLGRVVQKSVQDGVDVSNNPTYINTSYLFDQFDRLSVVISPELYKWFTTRSTLTTTQDEFKEGAYFYEYDPRGRLISKQVPGGGKSSYVYDKFDRVVLENDLKDANTTPVNYYIFKKYDALGRIIMTGLINNIGGFSRASLQNDFDIYTGTPYETRTASGGLLGYTNTSFPSSYTPAEISVKSVMYYDNYDWNVDVLFYFQPANAFHVQEDAKGKMTGKLKRNLRTGTWQKMVLYYDFKGRVIEDFHLTNRGNLIRKDYQYRFNGELLKTKVEKKLGTVVLSTKVFSYDYDHLGRKIKYKYLLNGQERTIAIYTYDAIGRMSSKVFSPSTPTGSKQTGSWFDNATWLTGSYPTLSDQVTINAGHTVTIQSGNLASAGMLNDNGILQNNGTLNLGNVNPTATTLQLLLYQYHIRGGLKGINLDASGNLTNNIFSYRLDYETGTNGYYDSNISKQWWKSNIDGKERTFSFTYDDVSRLKSSTYSSTQAGENYALDNVNYDKNGNITNLSRNGLKSDNTFGVIDNLNYTYNSNSNKILKVDDVSTEIASFRDVTGNDYTYWQDGSLRSDNNKEITDIAYNYLKLPEEITLSGGRWIRYDYDADGIKLKKTLSTGKYIDYEEDEIYEDGVLYQTGNDEGRIVNGIYEYDIKDHLGNTRISFKDNNGNAQITQVNHVGAWGESLESLSYTNTPKVNNFTLSTYEKENDFGIGVFDAHARMYDPLTPKMWQIDLLADKFRKYSPYSYSLNNPLRFIDPSGMAVESIEGGVRFTEEDAASAFSVLTGRKRNVVIDVTDDANAGEADSKVNYNNWATFSVSNLSLANDVLGSFGKGSIKNLVIGSHGLNIFTNKVKTGFRFQSDAKRGEGFKFGDVRTYNETGSVGGVKGENLGISMLQNIMEKVENGGNCIFAVCYLGQSDNGVGEGFAQELSTLSGNRISLYTYSEYTSIWRYSGGGNIGAIGIGGDAKLESKLSSPSAYWSKVQGGRTETLKKIILSDSANPVEFKK